MGCCVLSQRVYALGVDRFYVVVLESLAAATRPFPCVRVVRVLSQAERAAMNYC